MNPSTALGRVLVDELVRCGVGEAVLAPGSRSAPVALALQAAAEEERLRLHVRVDERSAAFLALGLARAGGAPVAVLTTSGTAAANLHPAVLEADQSGVPLVVLTADRPPELRGTGANQTVDQVGLYGRAVRLFAEVGAPAEIAGQNAYWRALVSRAIATATGARTHDPGPVHLNLALREPLVPDEATRWVEPLDGRADGRPWTEVATVLVGGDAPDDLPARTLVVVGDCPEPLGHAALGLAESRDWPVLSEPSGNARSGPHALTTGDLLLRTPGVLARLAPERLLVVGRPTLSRGVRAVLAAVPFDVVAPHARWADQVRLAERVLPALPSLRGHRRSGDTDWLHAWTAADRTARAAVDAVLDDLPWPSEPAVARAVVGALPAGALLVAGSSTPVRDLFVAAPAREEISVLANRGAAGIDGTVSTAVGAALAWQSGGGGPAAALLGDLTFLHDANGLALGPSEARPDLTFVVVDNDGGAIFSLLEQGGDEPAPAFERVFGTPHGVDLTALAGAHGVPVSVPASPVELADLLAEKDAGLRVVHLRTDRSQVRDVARRLREAVASAVG